MKTLVLSITKFARQYGIKGRRNIKDIRIIISTESNFILYYTIRGDYLLAKSRPSMLLTVISAALLEY